MNEHDPPGTETFPVPVIPRLDERVILAALVLAIVGTAFVGSALLARADTGSSTGRVASAEPGRSTDRERSGMLPLEIGDALTVEAAPRPPAAPPPPDGTAAGTAALESLPFDLDSMLPGWVIELSTADEDLLGGTSWESRRITIWVRPDQTVSEVRHVIAHEVGHALDVTYLDAGDRRRWREQRELGSVPWWPESGENDYASPAGDLAESMAVWVNGPDHWAGTGPLPDADDLAALARLVGL